MSNDTFRTRLSRTNLYLENRWEPEHKRFQAWATRNTAINSGLTVLALAAVVAALTLGNIIGVTQMTLFGIALVAIAVNSLYDFKDRARRYQRVAAALLREKSLYEVKAGVYADNELADKRLEMRCEAIINTNGEGFAPLVFEDVPYTKPEPTSTSESASSTTSSRFGSSSFGRRLGGSSSFSSRSSRFDSDDDDDIKDNDSDDDNDDNPLQRRNPFSNRPSSSSSTSPFGSNRSSSGSPFSGRSSGGSPFGSRPSSSDGRSRFSGNRPIGSSGGMRREDNDDPALEGYDPRNGKTGVRFAAYYPKELSPDLWQPIKAYALMGFASESVVADAEGGKNDKQPEVLFERSHNTRYRIPEGAQVTVVPNMKGFQFNPHTISIGFYRTWHRFDFEMRAVDVRLDEATNGYLTFLVNGLIVADLPLSVYVGQGVGGNRRPPITRRVFRKPYRTVYASFADEDRQLATRFEDVYEALGMYSGRDLMQLRAKGEWNTDMLNFIDQAEVFQLFWSNAASQSENIQQEIHQALARSTNIENFIRPVHWEHPTAPLPSSLQTIRSAYVPDIAEQKGNASYDGS